MSDAFADKIEMQHRLFAELSEMFGAEVPLYDKSLLVNRECNRAVCHLLGQRHRGFTLTDAELDESSRERHGAIRIGQPGEYRLVCQFFAAFAMEPHNFYDMANVGVKSQPIIATAFRSRVNPDHRIFTSLLLTDFFDPATRARIEALLATREVFSERARQLVAKNEAQEGLDWEDAKALIAEGVNGIFKWTGHARDYPLYQELCRTGFKIAADIACFQSHHLNHLTPNTFCMDLYTAAMKFCLGELSAATFETRAQTALSRTVARADRDWMRLHFKHMERSAFDGFQAGVVPPDAARQTAAQLLQRLQQADLDLQSLNHSGFKDFTEGPPQDTPVLLRQDAYKALTEPVQFHNPDGSVVDAVHTARFGEIEQRFYATTPQGRALYDECLAMADAAREQNPDGIKTDFAAYEAACARAFAPFPKTLRELVRAGLVYARYQATPQGLAQRGQLHTTDLNELIERGCVDYEGLRYEDFLPVSAAGIFASNLSQYGTRATAPERPVYTQADLEGILDRKIVDANATYAGLQAQSQLQTYADLGLLEQLRADEKAQLETAAAALAD
ncbi:MAG TPA: DUF1338 family protein [Verrucomicrobiota bacterium]|nr:DUF1338 family protein [Verrucomicrobiota bacterium]HNT14063.1 DUF1338 family protein [Verrucomicrobiota bacterium]